MGKINKFLCKWFDVENKGYVTIGDFIKGIICTIFIVSVIAIVIHSLFEFASKGIIYNNDEIPSMLSFYMLGGLIFILIAAMIIIFVISFIVILMKILLDIRIAECKIKKDDNKVYEPLKAEKEGDI